MESFEKNHDTLSTEKIDKKEEKEKKDGFNFNKLIDKIEDCNAITRLKDKRNSMTEKQKSNLYKNSEITLSGMLFRTTGIYPLYQSLKGTVNGAINTAKHGGSNAVKFAFLEKIPCRFLVQLGILQKPEGITKNNLVEDIKKDAKHFHSYLGICEAVCLCIPEANTAVPFIKGAKAYASWYREHGTEVIADRLKKQKELAVSAETNEALSTTIKEIKDNNKETKKAA